MSKRFVSEIEADEWEVQAAKAKDSLENWRICSLCSEVRRLNHELIDPNYLYACTRIHRQAIISRDGDIERLREENKKLREELENIKIMSILPIQ